MSSLSNISYLLFQRRRTKKKNSSKECKKDLFINDQVIDIQNKTKDKSGILKKRSASLKIEYIIFPHVLSVIGIVNRCATHKFVNKYTF